MRDKKGGACLLCLAGAVTVGAADLVASEVQVPVALLLLFSGALGLVAERWAWVWGLVLGCSVFCAHALAAVCGYEPPYRVQPNLLVTFLALIPALLGSFSGASLKWAIRQSRRRTKALQQTGHANDVPS